MNLSILTIRDLCWACIIYDLQDLDLTNQQYFQSNFVWDLINDQQQQFEVQLDEMIKIIKV